MRVAKLQLIERRLELGATVGPPHARAKQRRGLRVRVETDTGHVGWGEAAPLPGHSRDTLDACRAALEGIEPARLPPLDAHGDRLRHDIAVAGGLVTPAAARSALETALFDAVGQARGEPAWWLFRSTRQRNGPAPSLMPVAALVDAASIELAVAAARRAVAGGARCLKLKLGRDLERDVETVETVRRAIGDAVELRIDANRAWSPGQARQTLRALAPARLELAEECTPWERLSELGPVDVPLALDESLDTPDAIERLGTVDVERGVRALVLKPTLLGGPTRVLALAERAHSLGIDVVLSHCFGGAVELALGAALALAVGTPTRAQGLAWHAGVQDVPRDGLLTLPGAHVLCSDAPGLALTAAGIDRTAA